MGWLRLCPGAGRVTLCPGSKPGGNEGRLSYFKGFLQAYSVTCFIKNCFKICKSIWLTKCRMTFWKPEHLSACLAFCSARWEVSLFLVFLHSGLEEVSCLAESASWCGKLLHRLSQALGIVPFPFLFLEPQGRLQGRRRGSIGKRVSLATKTGLLS